MLVGDTAYNERLRFRRALEATRETTAKGLEHQRKEVARNAPVDGADPTKLHDQMGRPLWWKDFIGRLKKLNGALQFQDSPSAPDKTVALLYPASEKQDDGGEKTVLRFLCAFDKTMLPEYTVLMPTYDKAWDTEKRDLVQTLKTTKFLRGWREVLVMLLRTGLVRMRDTEALFPLAGNLRKSWKDHLNAPPKQPKSRPTQGLIEVATR